MDCPWAAGDADDDTDRAVQPQALQRLVSGACLHADARLHHLLAAQPVGMRLGLAGWHPRQREQLDAVYRSATCSLSFSSLLWTISLQTDNRGSKQPIDSP